MYGIEQTGGVEESRGRLVQLMQLNVHSGHLLLLKGYLELIDQGLKGINEGCSPK